MGTAACGKGVVPGEEGGGGCVWELGSVDEPNTDRTLAEATRVRVKHRPPNPNLLLLILHEVKEECVLHHYSAN